MKLNGLVRLIVCLLAILLFQGAGFQHVSAAQAPNFSAPPKSTRARQDTRTVPPKNRSRTPTRKAPTRRANVAASQFPEPEVITLDTKDGVTLTCTWFAPADDDKAKNTTRRTTPGPSVDGKSTAPFILLHDWDRSREDLLYLGRYLQLAGHAVIVPDFRGHGDSLKVIGLTKPIDRTRFRKNDIATLLVDIETCKKFLMRKNDAGEVNIDLLSVVAVGKTASLAMQWAITDWSWPPVGSIKQGQDVKSLILIAPEQKFKGVSIKPLLKNALFVGGPAEPLPMLFVYASEHSESVDETTDIFGRIEKARSTYAKAWREQMAQQPKAEAVEPEVDPDDDEAEVKETVPPPPPIDPMRTFVAAPVPGSTAPGSLLISSPQSQGVFRFIDQFYKQAVLSRQVAYPWQKRLDE